MTKLLKFLAIVCLLLDTSVLGRKLKRRESYHLSVPPPPPPQAPSQTLSQSIEAERSGPYHFEEIEKEAYALVPPEQPHYTVQRYESKYYNHHTTGSGGNYLVDNGLRSIAKGSADQALGAVASQNAAGKQAAFVAKNTLAQAAAQAAGTAIAALKGKEVLLRRLEEQNVDAVKSMENEIAQLQQAKRSAKAAQYSAQQAINHVSVLTAALNNAQTASELAQKSASEAAAELSSQIDMVAQAKAKLEAIEGHLYAARLDYEETKEAAEKATISAQEAQINANDAGAHANVELSDTATAFHHNIQEKSDQNVATSNKKEQQRRPSSSKQNRRNLRKKE